MKLIHAFFGAVLVAGASGRSCCAAEPSPPNPHFLACAEPKVLTGTIYAKDTAHAQGLFRFRRTVTPAGPQITVLREFTYPEGKPAAREQVTYGTNGLVSYSLEELQIGAAGGVVVNREPGNPAKGRLVFTYNRDVAGGGKPRTSTEAWRRDTLVTDMVGPFLAQHWAELARGEKVRCRMVVVPRRETVGFTFSRQEQAAYHGRRAVILRMEATSPIIARLVDPLYFTVEEEAPHRVFQFVGRMTPKVKANGAWQDLDARMVIDWPGL